MKRNGWYRLQFSNAVSVSVGGDASARASHLAQCCVIVKLCMDTRIQLSAHLVGSFYSAPSPLSPIQVLKCQLCTQHIVCALRISDARVPMVLPSIGDTASRPQTCALHIFRGTVGTRHSNRHRI